jgi:hypothetical protein
MDATRRDYFRQARLLQRQLGVLVAIGLLLSWGMSHLSMRWLELLLVAALLACCAGVFVVSARLFTRHHPAISVFNDRVLFRGLREQVVMLRNVRDARLVEQRWAGLSRRWIELTVGQPADGDADDSERVRVGLDAIEADPDEVMELIRQRAALQREHSAPAH